MRPIRAALAAALSLCALPAAAQIVTLPQVKNAGGQNVPSQGAVLTGADGAEKGTVGNPLVTIGKLESYQLVAANTPIGAAVVAGGDYILTQTCTSYGTLSLQALGPDGTTFQTLLSKTASDTAGGTGLSLGSYATVRITVTSTAGCYAILARVPA